MSVTLSIKVSAVDVPAAPSDAVYLRGEFYSGEIWQMAISQVRIKLNGQRYVLTYHGETALYEGQITPSASS